MRPVLASFALLSTLWGAAARGEEERPPLAPLLETVRASQGVPALAAARIRLGAEPEVAAVGRRRADRAAAVTVADRWHLGSCTKALTATALALRVERGQLRFTTSLAEVFPDLAPKLEPAWRAVTLEQLLSHRSGATGAIEQERELWDWLWKDEGPLPDQRRRVLEVLGARAPDFAPGSRFTYSNAGYVMAGAVLERVAGKPWEQVVREELFAPLGIRSAGFGAPGEAGADDQPRGHQRRGEAWVPLEPDQAGADNPPGLGPAGTVHMSLGDWARFARLHLQGARGEGGLLLRKETLAELQRLRGDEHALGWMVLSRAWAGGEGRALQHSGSNTLWFAIVWLAPARGAAFLAATNCGGDPGFKAADGAIAAMVAREEAAGWR